MTIPRAARRAPGFAKLAVILGVLGLVVAGVIWSRVRPVAVERAPVRRGSVAREVMGTGTLAARVSAVISPRVAGLLTSVLVDQGDHVKRGQLLATLYDGDVRAQQRLAEADVAVAQAAVDQTKADIAAALATDHEARASYARASGLHAAGLMSRDDFDKALERRDLAVAALERARVSQVAASRQVRRSEAAVRYAGERLTDTRIVAPFDGFVTKRARDPGNVAVPGDAILQIVSLDTLWIAAWVDEVSMAPLAVGQRARVVFRSEPAASYEGKVARVEPQVDPETREFLVDVTVDRLPANWGIGQRAEVYIETARRDGVLLVPARALVDEGGKQGVFLAEGGRAQWRPLELGLRGTEVVEVRAGLGEGASVIWPAGPRSEAALGDGRRVRAP